MDDPSGYTCIGCSQKLIRIPNAIAIKVSDVKATEASASLGTVASLFLNKFIVVLEKAHYPYGITKRYRYNTAPSLSISRVVQPSDCDISPALLDNNVINKYSLAMIYIQSLIHIWQT